MSVEHGYEHVATLDPHRTRSVVQGLVALVCLATLSATVFGLLTWGVVQLLRMLAA
jgi:hypothetical protein